MGENLNGGYMKKKYHRDGNPEEVKGVIRDMEETNPELAEILKRHIDPITGIPRKTEGDTSRPFPPPTEKELSRARFHEINLTKHIPEGDL